MPSARPAPRRRHGPAACPRAGPPGRSTRRLSRPTVRPLAVPISVARNRFREWPISTGRPKNGTPRRARESPGCAAAVLPKPIPGSTMIRSRQFPPVPVRRPAAGDSRESPPPHHRNADRFCIVCGVPWRCITITPQSAGGADLRHPLVERQGGDVVDDLRSRSQRLPGRQQPSSCRSRSARAFVRPAFR